MPLQAMVDFLMNKDPAGDTSGCNHLRRVVLAVFRRLNLGYGRIPTFGSWWSIG